MTIANQSIASMGMVDGYKLALDVGDITFQKVTQNATIPEPATLLVWSLLGLSAVVIKGRRRKKALSQENF
jgi:hypothetical protein